MRAASHLPKSVVSLHTASLQNPMKCPRLPLLFQAYACAHASSCVRFQLFFLLELHVRWTNHSQSGDSDSDGDIDVVWLGGPHDFLNRNHDKVWK